MTSGGKRKGAGRPARYSAETVGFTITWPQVAIEEAKRKATKVDLALSEYLLVNEFGYKYHLSIGGQPLPPLMVELLRYPRG